MKCRFSFKKKKKKKKPSEKQKLILATYAVPPSFFERLASLGGAALPLDYRVFFIEVGEDKTTVIEKPDGITFMMFSDPESMHRIIFPCVQERTVWIVCH